MLVPLLPRADGLHVLLTERSAELRAHAGQISFPGGTLDPTDADARAAALREAREEVGLWERHVRVVGELDDCRTVSSCYLISPVVGVVDPAACGPDGRYPFVAHPGEIARLHELPLQAFLAPGCLRTEERELEGHLLRLYWYTVPGAVVWGATARILHQLLALAAGADPGLGPSRGEPPP